MNIRLELADHSGTHIEDSALHSRAGANIKTVANSLDNGEMVQISKVDDRGRIKLSKEIAKPGSSIVIIDARTYFLGIPIDRDRVNASGSWLKSDQEIKKRAAMLLKRAGAKNTFRR